MSNIYFGEKNPPVKMLLTTTTEQFSVKFECTGGKAFCNKMTHIQDTS